MKSREPSTAGRLLTITEVSEWLGIPVKTIYGWNYLGTGPARIRCGRTVRYRAADVEAWLRSRTETPVVDRRAG